MVIAAQNCAQSGIDHPVFGPDEDVWSFDTPGEDRVARKFHDKAEDNGLSGRSICKGCPGGTRALVKAFVADLLEGDERCGPSSQSFSHDHEPASCRPNCLPLRHRYPPRKQQIWSRCSRP